ncbi:MAG: type VI secretion system Vgr family protein [Planctomycetota bacterium]|jgi:type VI secretion system secreted protein VgrG
MALIRDLSKAQLAFQIADGAVDQFEVMRYRGSEGLCQLYRFEIELASTEEQVPFDTVVGKAAVLSINTDYGERWFHGVISRFEFTGETTGQNYYRAELMPSLWLLTHRYNCRIFQEKTIPDIISEVLTKGGIASDRFKVDGLGRSYEPREYCVQYRETDFNFICRLMEEEGIRWYFEQSKEGHVLVLEDGDKSTYTAIEGESQLPYHPPTGMNVQQEHVFRYRQGQSVRPGAVVLNDFYFKNPTLELESGSDCGRDTGLEFFDCPGEYFAQGTGQDLATLRAEEFEAARTIGLGQSNSPRLVPGRTFEMIEHPAGFDGIYYISAVTHQGKQSVTRTTTGGNGRMGLLDARIHQSLVAARQNENSTIRELAEGLLEIIKRLQGSDATAHRALTEWLYHAGQVSRDLPAVAEASGGSPLDALSIPNLMEDVADWSIVDRDAPVYECRFACIPAEVSYRPPRVTPWPVMRGTQTARVVGPEGEEIHTDEYGRVKVQFHWDREGGHQETASCWIRVCQGMAGGNYGIMFLPRVGQEVVVDFLEGDPDQPMIVGRVYNADHMPPYKLPDEKTKSVIKTHSSKGGGGTNEIRFEDLKDKEQLFVQAQRMMDTRVKASHMDTVGGSYHLDVGGEKDGELHGEYRQLIYEAKHTHVKGERRTWIEMDDGLQVDGNLSIKVGGTMSTDVAKDVVDKFGAAHKHEVTMNYALKALGVKIEASTGIELKCGGSSIVLTPAAIFIMGGPLVNINTGSGPPVSPVTAMATAPAKTEDPALADKSEPGKDTRYDGGEVPEPAEAVPGAVGEEFEPTEDETESSWISIELVDEADMPVPSERYEITAPDGTTILKGSLDANGQARRIVKGKGNCQIAFPNLDMAAWERI